MMLPNNNRDSILVVYLIFLYDIINILESGYNWGKTVLSCLYFNFF
jgi:hypothetical protein